MNRKTDGTKIVESIESEEPKLLDLKELEKPERGAGILKKIRDKNLFKKDDYAGDVKDGVEIVDVKAVEK